MDEQATCKTCRFWDGPQPESPENETIGACRRHAPRIVSVDAPNTYSEWPRSLACDWCGEYEAQGDGYDWMRPAPPDDIADNVQVYRPDAVYELVPVDPQTLERIEDKPQD